MKRIPIRLGPLALLLTVIVICMSMLGLLSVADASADLRLAERYGETVRIRYSLEEKGQWFLKETDEAAAGSRQAEFEEEGYTLQIELDEGSEGLVPVIWKIRKEWEEVTEIDDLWKGN